MAATINTNATSSLSPRASAVDSSGPHAPPRRESPPPWNQSSPNNAALESGVMISDVSWPSLSESTSASPKPSVAEVSSTNLPGAPISIPQAIAATESSSPPSPHKKANTKPNKPNPNPNFKKPVRQKSMNRDNGGSSSSDGSFSQSSSTGDTSHPTNNLSKTSSGGFDNSGRDHGHSSANRDRPQQRTYRRSNSGPHLRGDGSFGGRRDNERRNNDWSHQRSFNGRDSVMPQQRGGPNGYIRPPPPPPGATSYFPPPPPLPYGGLMGIPPEMQPLYYFPPPPPGMPVVAPMPPAVYYPPLGLQLHAKIINQIDYYFSNDNLIKDTYLRKNMDEYGWVSIELIAKFKKVMELTTDIQLILDVLRGSSIVEVQGDKIRKRDEWMRWILPSSAQFAATTSGTQHSPHMTQDTLPAHVQGLTLQEKQD